MKSLNQIGIIATASTFYLTAVFPALAQTSGSGSTLSLCPESGSNFDPLCKKQPGDIGTIIGRVIVLAMVIAAIIALAFLIYGGIKWILSGGDKGKVDEARKTIIGAIIGLIIVFLSFFILNFLFQIFNLGSIQDINFNSLQLYQ